MSSHDDPAPPRPRSRTPLFNPAAGALYIHLQSESGVSHRTIVIPAARVRALRTLFSGWGVALALALGGSWLYFAAQSMRVPMLTRQLTELRAEQARLDTLDVRLRDLQQRYDQVQRMLGVPSVDSGG